MGVINNINKIFNNEKYFMIVNFLFKLISIILSLLFEIIYKMYFINDNYNYDYLNNKIRIGIVSQSLKNGGSERQTSLLLHYFNKVKNFELFLFTFKGKEKDEYKINNNTHRIIIKNNLNKLLIENNIDILIYQLYNKNEMKDFSKLNKTKIIFINRSCFLHWIYYNKTFVYKEIYNIYKKSKYIISLIPFENEYLFKKWGINSILMNNFIPYIYESIVPSDLSSKTIIMIGRADDKIKRFELGIKAMKYIISEIPDCEMKIISEINNNDYLNKLVEELNLEKNIKYVGYTSNPQNYYKNASLHIFPTLVEAFPNVLSETLIYGIPTILVGLDYVSTAKGGGVIIIYDDSPISIANIAIKILKNKRFRKILGRDARKNIKRFRNNILLNKWVKLIFSIYKGYDNYEELRSLDKKINEKDSILVLENQIKLLKNRNSKFNNISMNDIENFTFMVNLK